ncbi:MAG: P1 family peptidase [Chloroflexi bacterium]|nr:P1 family peptidase [Chloroflexota bacterium]
MNGTLTDVPGLKVGHWTNLEAATGCTVTLCPQGAVAGVDVRGSAPGTRETDLLDPVNMVEKVHAILIGGGSAYGLAAADGVMRWLEEHGYGFDVGVAKVPIVPAAILFDLGIGSAKVRPDAAAGYAACEAATEGPVALGNAGAGTGATTGKALGFNQATKAGLGSSSKQIAGGIVVAAMVAVNAFGDVYDPKTQQIIAGVRKLAGGGFADTVKVAESLLGRTIASLAAGRNTTLAVVATNAALTKSGATKVAQMAHDGLARTIRPVHTMFDGDTVFALSCGDRQADLNLIGALAADVLAEAVVSAVMSAESLAGIPAARELALR